LRRNYYAIRSLPGTVEGHMSALRFLYKTLKQRDITYDDLIFPKVPRKPLSCSVPKKSPV
jgi:hypothetical protein